MTWRQLSSRRRDNRLIIAVAIIAAGPPALASVLWYSAHRRLRRSLGASPGVPLSEVYENRDPEIQDRLDALLDARRVSKTCPENVVDLPVKKANSF